MEIIEIIFSAALMMIGIGEDKIVRNYKFIGRNLSFVK